MITQVEFDNLCNDFIIPLDITDENVINTYIPKENREYIMKEFIIPNNGIELRRIINSPIRKAIHELVTEELYEKIHHKINSIDVNWTEGFVPFVTLRGVIHQQLKSWIENEYTYKMH